MKKRKTSRLLISNHLLSGVLFLLGFPSPERDVNEREEVVPMYGMPVSIYKDKEKAAESHDISLKQTQNVQ